MHIIVRPLSKSDSQNELSILFDQLTPEVWDFDVISLTQTTSCYCCVVEQKGKLVGFGALTFFLIPTKGFVGMIEDIVVDEKYRLNGIGTKIINHLIVRAKAIGLVRVELTSNPKRKVARRLYPSLGFNLIDTGVFRKVL